MKLLVNGQAMTWLGSLEELVEERFSECDLILINGVQSSKESAIKEGDEIYLISKKGKYSQELTRCLLYSRHSQGIQSKIEASRAIILGLGGIGSSVAMHLTRLGIGHLTLVDFDLVDPTNIHRQMYCLKDLGRQKTDALKEALESINPYVELETRDLKVTKENLDGLLQGETYVIEAFDCPEAKAMVAIHHLSQPGKRILISCSGMAGDGPGEEIRVNRKKPHWYVVGDETTGVEAGLGLMSPRVGICASQMANLWLRLVLGKEQ